MYLEAWGSRKIYEYQTSVGPDELYMMFQAVLYYS